MATEKQVEKYIELCEQLGQDADAEEFERKSNIEAGKDIAQLINMQKKDVGSDNVYWY